MSYACDAERATLVLIDLQEKLMPAMQDGDAVIDRAAILAEAAGRLNVPVIGTAQYPKGLGDLVPAIAPLCDRVIEKTRFSAAEVPDFRSALDTGRYQIILAGCEAHVCVLQTAFGLREQGFDVRIAADAVASRMTPSRDLALDRARAAGVTAVTTEMVLFEWLGDARHPEFKALSGLIK